MNRSTNSDLSVACVRTEFYTESTRVTRLMDEFGQESVIVRE